MIFISMQYYLYCFIIYTYKSKMTILRKKNYFNCRKYVLYILSGSTTTDFHIYIYICGLRRSRGHEINSRPEIFIVFVRFNTKYYVRWWRIIVRNLYDNFRYIYFFKFINPKKPALCLKKSQNNIRVILLQFCFSRSLWCVLRSHFIPSFSELFIWFLCWILYIFILLEIDYMTDHDKPSGSG